MPLLDLCILLDLHLPQLLILDLLEHLLLPLQILNLLTSALDLHLLDILDPLLVRHVQFGPLVELAALQGLEFGAAEGLGGGVDEPRDSLPHCPKRSLLTRLRPVTHAPLRQLGSVRVLRQSINITLRCPEILLALRQPLLLILQLLFLTDFLDERFNFGFEAD